jgi:hypothetical protein
MSLQSQRDLSIAIAEFAPTSKLIANKRKWTSSGLKKVAEKEWPRRFYKRCIQDNVFLHWEKGKAEPQTPCAHALFVGSYLIPQFGFVADRAKPKPPKARPARVFTTRPYFAGPHGSERGEITVPASKPLICLKKASPGRSVVNVGSSADFAVGLVSSADQTRLRTGPVRSHCARMKHSDNVSSRF